MGTYLKLYEHFWLKVNLNKSLFLFVFLKNNWYANFHLSMVTKGHQYHLPIECKGRLS